MGHTVRDFSNSKGDLDGRPFNHSIVENLFKDVDAAIVALTPDEESILIQSLRGTDRDDWEIQVRTRPNVLIEHGMAVAKLEGRVIEVAFNFPHIQIPSDWTGLNAINWDTAISVARQIQGRLATFEIKSNEIDSKIEMDCLYVRPQPGFDEARPPYEFIVYPCSLEKVNMNPLSQPEVQQYEEAGITIRETKPIEQLDHWMSQGWQPFIHKDVQTRKYVWPGVRICPGDVDLKMWMYK